MLLDFSRSVPPAKGATAGARVVLADTLREELAARGSLVMEASGTSMAPTVPTGSVLRIEPLRGPLRSDELIVFVPRQGVLLCCHRVVALGPEGTVRTQGDGRTTPDDAIGPERIVGVVRSFVLGGRAYALSPGARWPRPSAYRIQRQRVSRLLRRLSAV
jgi:hypothetical protein